MQPHTPDRARAAADVAACAALLRGGSRSFFAASLLLPRRVREPATALYAFCRLADDSIDLGHDLPATLAAWHERLDRIYAGRPMSTAVDRALCEVVSQHAIPRALPDALLEGFHWDALGRRYEDLSALRDYGARVAGTVGAMMALVMGARSPEAVARACDLGVAMQLTNIARDVGEDARAGRLYLPLAWLREARIEPERWIRKPEFSPALGAVVGRLLDAAGALYRRGSAGVADLPWDCRPGIRTAALLYAEIGEEVRRRGLDSVSQRAVVAAGRKSILVARSLGAMRAAAPRRSGAPLEETRFLVEAAACAPPLAGRGAAKGRDGDRLVSVLALFEKLERRDRLLRAGSPRRAGA